MGYVPNVIRPSRNGEDSLDIYSSMLSDRVVFLDGEITNDTASVVVAQLLHLESQDPDREIQLCINCPGGSVTAGFAIYDTMRYLKCDVITLCMGLAASFGAVLLAGGTKGKRMALPGAEILLRQSAVTGVQGSAAEIRILSDHMQKTKDRINRILAENTGKPVARIAADTERDCFLSAREALDYGLIDKIITRR